jgi:hypothetical protein
VNYSIREGFNAPKDTTSEPGIDLQNDILSIKTSFNKTNSIYVIAETELRLQIWKEIAIEVP